jgi:hypothetical protein
MDPGQAIVWNPAVPQFESVLNPYLMVSPLNESCDLLLLLLYKLSKVMCTFIIQTTALLGYHVCLKTLTEPVQGMFTQSQGDSGHERKIHVR